VIQAGRLKAEPCAPRVKSGREDILEKSAPVTANRCNGKSVVVTHVLQVGRLGRVHSSGMMVMKKNGEVVSQQRIVGNGSLEQSFLHFTRQVRPKPERSVAQQKLKLPGQIIHMPPLACLYRTQGQRTWCAQSKVC
jgi:hypothetical protein